MKVLLTLLLLVAFIFVPYLIGTIIEKRFKTASFLNLIDSKPDGVFVWLAGFITIMLITLACVFIGIFYFAADSLLG